jgi:hypothetical protein
MKHIKTYEGFLNTYAIQEEYNSNYIKNKLDGELDNRTMFDLLIATPSKHQQYELAKQMFSLVKDKLDYRRIDVLLLFTPKEQQYELAQQILPLVKNELDYHIIDSLLKHLPKEQKYELVKQIFPLVKDKLSGDGASIVNKLLGTTPKEEQYELVQQILPLVKNKLYRSMEYTILLYTPEEHKEEVQSIIDKYKTNVVQQYKSNLELSKVK